MNGFTHLRRARLRRQLTVKQVAWLSGAPAERIEQLESAEPGEYDDAVAALLFRALTHTADGEPDVTDDARVMAYVDSAGAGPLLEHEAPYLQAAAIVSALEDRAGVHAQGSAPSRCV